jgi:hypothetical protein
MRHAMHIGCRMCSTILTTCPSSKRRPSLALPHTRHHRRCHRRRCHRRRCHRRRWRRRRWGRRRCHHLRRRLDISPSTSSHVSGRHHESSSRCALHGSAHGGSRFARYSGGTRNEVPQLSSSPIGSKTIREIRLTCLPLCKDLATRDSQPPRPSSRSAAMLLGASAQSFGPRKEAPTTRYGASMRDPTPRSRQVGLGVKESTGLQPHTVDRCTGGARRRRGAVSQPGRSVLRT